TLLNKYIATYYSLVFINFVIKIDRRLTSKGFIINLYNNIVFSTFYDTFFINKHYFETPLFFFKLGSRIVKRKIINKKALEYFLYNSVKDPIKVILNELRKVEEVKTMSNLSNRIVFKNYLYTLSNVAPEVVERNLLLIPPSILYNRRVNF
ncbi:hypothetical protein BDP67DRAFT_390133, partial [Colletotrichum lupini]